LLILFIKEQEICLIFLRDFIDLDLHSFSFLKTKELPMRQRSFYRTFYSAFLILLLFVNTIAQFQLGSQGLTNAVAPTINTTTRIAPGASRGIPLRFLSRIGGVAFDGAAMPAGGMKVSNLQINYMPQNEDGKRLSVKLNTTQVNAPVYDCSLSLSQNLRTLLIPLVSRSLENSLTKRKNWK
jgi:hypothetical protein